MGLARDNGKCVECQKCVEFVELSKYKINFKYRTMLIFFNDQHYFFFYVGYYGLIYLVWVVKVNFPPVFIKLENTHVFWIFLWGLCRTENLLNLLPPKVFKNNFLEVIFILGGRGAKNWIFVWSVSIKFVKIFSEMGWKI